MAIAKNADIRRSDRSANPAYTSEELVHQLEATKSRLLIVHPTTLAVAVEAARAAGLPQERILLVEPASGSPYSTLNDVVTFGLSRFQQYTEMRMRPDEAKKKLALLLFSSGTTGKPKARAVVGVGPYTDRTNSPFLCRR